MFERKRSLTERVSSQPKMLAGGFAVLVLGGLTWWSYRSPGASGRDAASQPAIQWEATPDEARLPDSGQASASSQLFAPRPHQSEARQSAAIAPGGQASPAAAPPFPAAPSRPPEPELRDAKAPVKETARPARKRPGPPEESGGGRGIPTQQAFQGGMSTLQNSGHASGGGFGGGSVSVQRQDGATPARTQTSAAKTNAPVAQKTLAPRAGFKSLMSAIGSMTRSLDFTKRPGQLTPMHGSAEEGLGVPSFGERSRGAGGQAILGYGLGGSIEEAGGGERTAKGGGSNAMGGSGGGGGGGWGGRGGGDPIAEASLTPVNVPTPGDGAAVNCPAGIIGTSSCAGSGAAGASGPTPVEILAGATGKEPPAGTGGTTAPILAGGSAAPAATGDAAAAAVTGPLKDATALLALPASGQTGPKLYNGATTGAPAATASPGELLLSPKQGAPVSGTATGAPIALTGAPAMTGYHKTPYPYHETLLPASTGSPTTSSTGLPTRTASTGAPSSPYDRLRSPSGTTTATGTPFSYK